MFPATNPKIFELFTLYLNLGLKEGERERGADRTLTSQRCCDALQQAGLSSCVLCCSMGLLSLIAGGKQTIISSKARL